MECKCLTSSFNIGFHLLESEDEDEDKDTSSTKLDPDLMRKGLEPSHQGESINLDNLPHMQ